MSFSVFMDPLNWSYRYYLIKAIDKVGFEGGWAPIIEKVHLLASTLTNGTFKVQEKICHLFYLHMLAEFGDFRHFSDPLTPPSDEIKAKIEAMRRSELRHDLILTNNHMRHNNYIMHHHNHRAMISDDIHWVRFQSAEKAEKPDHGGFLAHVTARAKNQPWFQLLSANGKGPIGVRNLAIDTILTRCISGVVATPMELIRDVFHLSVNLEMAQPEEKERAAIAGMRNYFVDELREHLEKDPEWEIVQQYVLGNASD